MDLEQIILEHANYVKATHEVIVDRNMGTVAIVDKETGETDYFLQGDDANDYIFLSDSNYDVIGTITLEDSDHAIAKAYVDCI